ncbi:MULTISPECIES: DUF475 domain-containing protein [Clostridium]|uniref:Integral membrane protein TerC family protein n=2 Tax=Clostridium TaxID=1485 RepID=A0A162LEJ5_9CLOT|nr:MULTISPECIES: DUF475 domain-containing protein [Clostridium]ALU37222.1 hypothetical protein CLAU_2795 [Clostridium autoethanogenum DSM 10061]OAA92516.1 Integral membrane protein TerC family protein [Clostridium coskatii]OBR92274.1 integral membrane protein TerC family protein [Clostridium coskatii]OVY50210.1 Integral membrane protein TerC family protein [Clostridium autoethanogenum]RMC93198.1 DUF475 domain-containing protein [Clostridium autoethanogenum]
MGIISIILIIIGLCLFEVVSSIDNAVINAEVLSTMSEKAKKWFLLYGILFAVFIVRGLLPWAIVWATNQSLGPIGALTATFSNDPHIIESIEYSTPILMLGGGVFLVFLFLHWLFIEDKHLGLATEEFFLKNGTWFYAVVSVILVGIVAVALKYNPVLALSAVIGSSAFFITDGFKKNAEENEKKLIDNTSEMSDISKILYLEIIDTTFSIDGVLGAFAFTMSIPLIILGNGIGAIVVRKITMGSIEKIKKYIYLKNGAMYSVLCLGIVMVLEGFHVEVPEYISPLLTILIIMFFFFKSKIYAEKNLS